MTCMKYNSLLIAAREAGHSDSSWQEMELSSPLEEIYGEFYYCDGLIDFRQHVEQAVARELQSHA